MRLPYRLWSERDLVVELYQTLRPGSAKKQKKADNTNEKKEL